MIRLRCIRKEYGDTSTTGLLGEHLGVRAARGGHNPCHAGLFELGDSILSSPHTALVRNNLNLNIVAALSQTPYGHLGSVSIADPAVTLARILRIGHN